MKQIYFQRLGEKELARQEAIRLIKLKKQATAVAENAARELAEKEVVEDGQPE